MEKWKIVFSSRTAKDWKFISESKYKEKVCELLEVIEQDPFYVPPQIKQLQGDLKGAYSRRINFQHRLVYRVDKEKKMINIIMMWLHYE